MSGSLTWIGDNIGQQLGTPIAIDLQDKAMASTSRPSVASTLILLNRIDEAERQRILSALRHCAERGELNAADMQAYQAWSKINQVDR